MRTIKPITSREVALLRFEAQAIIQLVPRFELPARIVARLTVDERTGCWRVAGWNSGNGFAKMSVGGRPRQVHRVIYTLLVGAIPDGHVLDHKRDRGCEHRDCGNRAHLEPVTVAVNTERGAAKLFQPRGNSNA